MFRPVKKSNSLISNVGRGKMKLAAFDGPCHKKTPRGAKNLPKISYASRVIANFVPNFIAMATRGRGRERGRKMRKRKGKGKGKGKEKGKEKKKGKGKKKWKRKEKGKEKENGKEKGKGMRIEQLPLKLTEGRFAR